MILSRARALCATSRKRIGVAARSGAQRVTNLARRHGTSREFVRAQRGRVGHALELTFAQPSAPSRVKTFPRVSDAWVRVNAGQEPPLYDGEVAVLSSESAYRLRRAGANNPR